MVTQFIKLEHMTLKEALHIFQQGGDQQLDIPLRIRLLENSASPIALPGKIDLFNHDCLHILFERGKSSEDEAIILGVTFGSHPRFNNFHLAVFNYASRFLYPYPYRFTQKHLKVLKLAFSYAKQRKFPNFSQINFRSIDFQKMTIASLRQIMGIDQNDLNYLDFSECILLNL